MVVNYKFKLLTIIRIYNTAVNYNHIVYYTAVNSLVYI